LRQTTRLPVSKGEKISMPIHFGTQQEVSEAERSVWRAIRRGLFGRCPSCGRGALYRRYLKPVDQCATCGEALHHHRADDAPPYFTILIVGHLIVALVLLLETNYHPPAWVHTVIWTPLTLVLALAILPLVKGALIGLQWALRMHGFASGGESALDKAIGHDGHGTA